MQTPSVEIVMKVPLYRDRDTKPEDLLADTLVRQAKRD
jgi:hypothetical protein